MWPEHPSLDLMIAQMMMVGFRGLTLTADNPIVQDIRERQIGGVFLFDYDVPTSSFGRNVQSPDQVRALTTEIQNLAAIPMLIGIDQEGGQVARLKTSTGFPATVSAQYLGSANDLSLTRQYAEQMAALLAGLGINMNLATVVDVNLNPQNPIQGLSAQEADALLKNAAAKDGKQGHLSTNDLLALEAELVTSKPGIAKNVTTRLAAVKPIDPNAPAPRLE